jgi:hypothetical protein
MVYQDLAQRPQSNLSSVGGLPIVYNGLDLSGA